MSSGLAKHRKGIAIDLPGSGETVPLKGEVSIATLVDAVTSFLEDNHLTGIVAFDGLSSYANSPFFAELLYNVAYGEQQKGSASGTIHHPLVIGWGKQDRVCSSE